MTDELYGRVMSFHLSWQGEIYHDYRLSEMSISFNTSHCGAHYHFGAYSWRLWSKIIRTVETKCMTFVPILDLSG